ncbi:MAG: long-chain acyl-CoA synthetase [Verrucomicrobiota bacterium]|jgi:acyl-CoA synthetase (AMP-forming)/AMP-acid ligase II|nr:long-chain acyl-CoA synthetase [Verrucomicrobiota bacterium]
MRVADVLAKTAGKFGEKPAIVYRENVITFARLQEMTARLGNAFAGLGIEKGDRVAIWLPNCPEYVLAYLGALSIGAVVVPLDLGLKDELANCLTHAEAKLLLTNRFDGVDFGKLSDRAPSLRHIVFCEEMLPGLIRNASDRPRQVIQAESDPAIIFYTTGTTGRPKGVLWNLRHLDNAPRTMKHFLRLDENDVKLCAVPFSHSGGLVYIQNCITFGITMVLMRRFAPADFVDNIQRCQVTCFHIVPAMFQAILSLKRIETLTLPSIRWVAVFGAPSAPELIERFGRLCPRGKALNGYGLTETSPPTTLPPLDGIRRGSVGQAPPWVEMAILDGEGRPLPAGEVGEVAFRGWIVADGYYKAPELTRAALKDGWFCTGDLGRTDGDGYLFLAGRKKGVIIVGGLNVHADEVEFVLHEHPGVKDAAVVGVRQGLRGEQVKAVIVPKDGVTLTAGDIIAHCRRRLAPFKVPKIVDFVAELPRVGIGKVAKEQLR